MSIKLSWIPKGVRTMYVDFYAEHASKQALEWAASVVDKCSVLHVDNVDQPEYPYRRKHDARRVNGQWMVSLKYRGQ